MSGDSWNGYERLDMSNIVALEKRVAELDARQASLEKEIGQWKDRAGFLRSIVLAAIMTIGTIAAVIEWLRTNLSLK